MSETQAAEMVDHPQHYQGAGVECIDVIERYDLGFHLGNAVKYLQRAGRKGDAGQDVAKAIWYVRRWLGHPGLEIPFSEAATSWMPPDAIADAFGLAGPRRAVFVAILALSDPDAQGADYDIDLVAAIAALVQEAMP